MVQNPEGETGAVKRVLRSSLAQMPNGFIPGIVITTFLAFPALWLVSVTVSSWFAPELSMPTRGGDDGNLAREVILTLLVAAALVVARWRPLPSAIGARMPTPAFRGTPTTVAVLLTVGALGALTAVGLLGSWLGDILDVRPPGGQLLDSGDWYRSFPTQAVVVSSLYAGFTEEVLLFAAPVGLARWMGRRLRAPSPKMWMVLGGTAGLIFRSAMHWYQGWTSPLMVLLWGGSLLAIYLAWQSVYPLIAAHALHNFVIAWLAPQTDSALAIRLGVSLFGVAALALAVAVRVHRRGGHA